MFFPFLGQDVLEKHIFHLSCLGDLTTPPTFTTNAVPNRLRRRRRENIIHLLAMKSCEVDCMLHLFEKKDYCWIKLVTDIEKCVLEILLTLWTKRVLVQLLGNFKRSWKLNGNSLISARKKSWNWAVRPAIINWPGNHSLSSTHCSPETFSSP